MIVSMHVNARGIVICLSAVLAMAAVMKAKSRTAEPKSGISTRPYVSKIDPIKENGSIFVDWPKPDVLLVFSGEQDGYLEPCGCAGLENQKGGLQRRFTF